MRSCASLRFAITLALVVCAGTLVSGATPKSRYTEALGREALLRRDLNASPDRTLESPLLSRIRKLVDEYERIARQYPRSGYSDNALFQAATLSADAFWFYGEEPDRRAALRLFAALKSQFPSSSLVREVTAHAKRLDAAKPLPKPPARVAAAVTTSTPPAASRDDRATLRAIRREVLPNALRVTLELGREAAFRDERLDAPPRVFVDLQGTRAIEGLQDASFGFSDDVVRQIRVGRHVGATRVVLDLKESARHSVYALYNPYRVVIDFERTMPEATRRAEAAQTRPPDEPRKPEPLDRKDPGATWTRDAVPASTPEPAPAPPAANRTGGFSISRQLGLGISRVVIDAGHGGRDPGAHVKGLNEADVTLDVAQRLEKLLLAVPGVEVVMTRRTDVYIPLEERTAIANRAGADLFLSIHVNASRNSRASGIETYFLNFAPNPEAEAIAARENAGSSKTMHNLPEIVKAIALNNKIDESRDFAARVQAAMIERVKKVHRNARSLGVKQAPFVVLIGATMPSVLAEISFLTNRQEARLLKTPAYRQAIAEALFSGISNYQKSLKAAAAVAAQ
jgi:N-acetylmuramoyl-L-alanine amidase